MSSIEEELQERMNNAIDNVLECLDDAASLGVEIDPLETIIERFKARGNDFDLSTLPLPLQMLLAGMLG